MSDETRNKNNPTLNEFQIQEFKEFITKWAVHMPESSQDQFMEDLMELVLNCANSMFPEFLKELAEMISNSDEEDSMDRFN